MDTNFLEQVFWGNTVKEYVIAALVLFAGMIFIKIFVTVLIRRLKKFAETTSNKIDDLFICMLEKVALPALYISSVYFSVKTLELSPFDIRGRQRNRDGHSHILRCPSCRL